VGVPLFTDRQKVIRGMKSVKTVPIGFELYTVVSWRRVANPFVMPGDADTVVAPDVRLAADCHNREVILAFLQLVLLVLSTEGEELFEGGGTQALPPYPVMATLSSSNRGE
jgi:hypothetical protein